MNRMILKFGALVIGLSTVLHTSISRGEGIGSLISKFTGSAIPVSLPTFRKPSDPYQTSVPEFLSQGVTNLKLSTNTSNNELVLDFDYPEQRWMIGPRKDLSHFGCAIELTLYDSNKKILGQAFTDRLKPEWIAELRGKTSNTQKLGNTTIVTTQIAPTSTLKRKGNTFHLPLKIPLNVVKSAFLSFTCNEVVNKSDTIREYKDQPPTGQCYYFGVLKPIAPKAISSIDVFHGNCVPSNYGQLYEKDGQITN